MSPVDFSFYPALLLGHVGPKFLHRVSLHFVWAFKNRTIGWGQVASLWNVLNWIVYVCIHLYASQVLKYRLENQSARLEGWFTGVRSEINGCIHVVYQYTPNISTIYRSWICCIKAAEMDQKPTYLAIILLVFKTGWNWAFGPKKDQFLC